MPGFGFFCLYEALGRPGVSIIRCRQMMGLPGAWLFYEEQLIMSAKYTQVQFAGYAVSTHPRIYGDKSLYKFYAGIAGEGNESSDLAARLELLEKAVALAGQGFAPDDGIYRVFVIPEFFFRGPKGAYAGNVLKNSLLRGLDELLARVGGNIDLAVWGSSILADEAFDSEKPSIKTKLALGDDFLAVYQACRELRDRKALKTPELTKILFYLDELEAMLPAEADSAALKLDPLAVVLRDMLAACDLSAEVPVLNQSFVSCRGGRRLAVQKQYKSKVDFILNYYSSALRERNNAGAFLQTFVHYPDIPPTTDERKRHDFDPYCVFSEAGLEIGLEVCLDHIRRRLTRVGAKVDLQIIPSCGVEVTANAIAARSGGYVFNCDGDYNLQAARNGVGCHTQLYRVEREARAGEDAKLADRIEPEKVVRVEHSVNEILPHDAGELHIYAPQPL